MPGAFAFALLCVASAASANWPTSPAVNLPVCTAPNTQFRPAVATDMAGGVYVAWDDQRTSANPDIYAMHVLASGVTDPAWPVNGQLVCNAAGNQTGPKMASDGSGGVILAWTDARSGSNDIYAHHLRSDGSLDPAWPANGLAVCTFTGGQILLPRVGLVSDQAGGAIIAWRDTRTDSDLYAARVLASGQLDPTWPVGGMPVAAGPGAQYSASIVSDGHGGLIAVWVDTRNGPAPDLYAQHLLVSGSIAPGWPVNGIPVCTAIGAQLLPSTATDGVGGAFVAWEDQRGGPSDIYVHHVRANGTPDPTWPADGRAACTAPGNQTGAQVLGDAAGGVFVAWTDFRAGAIPSLYAQHVLVDGSLDPAWPSADLNFNAAFGNHISLTLLPDGSGGALAVWDDARSALHVYAHHLLKRGTVDLGWPANGLEVSTAFSNSAGATIPDGSGGLIAAWIDSRPSTTGQDIYAQRVQANGQLGGTVVDVPRGMSSALTLAPLTPTPARYGRLGVRYTLPSEGEVSLELLDVAGRRLASRKLGVRSAGPHALDWELGTGAPTGLYFMRLRFGAETRTVRAITIE